MTRIVVFGYSLVGHHCLKALIEAGENVTGLVTHPDDPMGNLWFPSISGLAKNYNIPVVATENPKDEAVYSALETMQPDIIFSFYYRKMIPGKILDIPPLGCFNMHGSLLPRYRGRAPINWALVNGERETGVTLHHMVKSADAGNIVDQEPIPIGTTDTAFDLTHKVAEASVCILNRQLAALKQGRAPSRVQDNSLATYFGGRTAADSRINWHQSAWQIHNLIRAVPFPYYPPAFTYLNDQKIDIHTNQLPRNNQRLPSSAAPGQIVDVTETFARIACGDGTEFVDVTKLSVSISTLKTGNIVI
jgi:methionyl-tRNA formyltransferase